MTFAGVGDGGIWFMDTFAVLAAVDAKRMGLDPYAPNPLNYFGGTHVYSDWWFALNYLPITRDDSFWIGLLLVSLAIVTAWSILKPSNKVEVMWAVATLCSAPVILALNRANFDLLIFVILSGCVPALMSRNGVCRVLVPPALVAFAAGLKYYPALAGLIVLSTRKLAERWISTGIAVMLLLCVGISVGPSLSHYTSDRLPQGLHTFGAYILLERLGFSGPGAAGLSGVFLFGAGGLIGFKFFRSTWRVPPERERDYWYFIMGAVVLLGSFVATVNYAYRWIYAVWMIPFLCRQHVQTQSAGVAWLIRATRVLLIVALWDHAFLAMILNSTVHTVPAADRWIGIFLALEQPLIWGLFVCLGAWLCHFLYVQVLLPLRSILIG